MPHPSLKSVLLSPTPKPRVIHMQVASTTCNMARSLADGTYTIRLSGRSACTNFLSGAACPSAALSFVAAGPTCCRCMQNELHPCSCFALV